jgi:LysM repeat protein
MYTKIIRTITLAVFVFILCAQVVPVVQAAPLYESAYDLIGAVNSLRASYNMTAYEIDGSLMSIAQAQSEYQASIKTLTHTRPDGSGAASAGVTAENIAYGPISRAMASWLDDQLHKDTLLGFSSAFVGAGMATDSNGTVYYTLVIRRRTDTTQTSFIAPPAATQSGGTTTTGRGTLTVEPILTVTPQADGTIYHTASRGQTLWDIAISYGLTIVELVTLNRLSPSNPVIYENQKILVQASYTPTTTPTITNTPFPPTRTLRPTFTPRATRATNTITPTHTPTPKPLLPNTAFLQGESRQTTAIILISICGIGLLAVVLSGLFKNRKP